MAPRKKSLPKKKSKESPNPPKERSIVLTGKAEAKRKFDVYPSAYANAWLRLEPIRSVVGTTPNWRRINGL